MSDETKKQAETDLAEELRLARENHQKWMTEADGEADKLRADLAKLRTELEKTKQALTSEMIRSDRLKSLAETILEIRAHELLQQRNLTDELKAVLRET